MGKVVKAVIGAALVIFAPYVAGAIIGAAGGALAGATAYYAIAGAVTMLGASLAGSALTPDLPDMYGADGAGQKLQTIRNNTAAVPEVYGEVRIGSNIIWQVTGEQINLATNRDYWSIQVIANGEIDSFQSMYGNEAAMTNISGNIYTKTYVHVNGYTTSGATGMSVGDVVFVTTDAGATQTGTSLGIGAGITIPPNVAFIAVHQVHESTNHTQPDSITGLIRGKKVAILTDSGFTTAAYSTNPAEIVADIMVNGLEIPSADIDTASFYHAKLKCIEYGWTCNVAFMQQINMQSAIQNILATFRGHIVFSQGKWKLKMDEKGLGVITTLTEDDIINNSLGISMKGYNEIANIVNVKYVNPMDKWLPAKATIEDTDLITIDDQYIEKSLDIQAITSTAQAEQMAEITLNAMRYTESTTGARIAQTPLAVTLKTTVKHANLEVGDMIAISHSLLDRTRKFVIVAVSTDQSGMIDIIAREYCETHYKDTNENYII